MPVHFVFADGSEPTECELLGVGERFRDIDNLIGI